MLPVEEMRKLSQMVGIDDDTDAVAVEAPASDAAPAAPEETKAEEAVVEATVVVPPADAAPAPEEAK